MVSTCSCPSLGSGGRGECLSGGGSVYGPTPPGMGDGVSMSRSSEVNELREDATDSVEYDLYIVIERQE